MFKDTVNNAHIQHHAFVCVVVRIKDQRFCRGVQHAGGRWNTADDRFENREHIGALLCRYGNNFIRIIAQQLSHLS